MFNLIVKSSNNVQKKDGWYVAWNETLGYHPARCNDDEGMSPDECNRIIASLPTKIEEKQES